MQFQGAVIKEQGVTFGIIVVKPHVLNSRSESDEAQDFGVRAFGPMPIILMSQNSRGIPIYSGRRDIVNFLSGVHPSRIPFRRYTI
jgi:hypothetical protein